MNFLIELGFYLCTFNLKGFESIHSPFTTPSKLPMYPAGVSTSRSSLSWRAARIWGFHLNSQLMCFDFCFFTNFFYLYFFNIIHILIEFRLLFVVDACRVVRTPNTGGQHGEPGGWSCAGGDSEAAGKTGGGPASRWHWKRSNISFIFLCVPIFLPMSGYGRHQWKPTSIFFFFWFHVFIE